MYDRFAYDPRVSASGIGLCSTRTIKTCSQRVGTLVLYLIGSCSRYLNGDRQLQLQPNASDNALTNEP